MLVTETGVEVLTLTIPTAVVTIDEGGIPVTGNVTIDVPAGGGGGGGGGCRFVMRRKAWSNRGCC